MQREEAAAYQAKSDQQMKKIQEMEEENNKLKSEGERLKVSC